MSLNIPKIFHCIWLGPAPLPTQHKTWLNTWTTLNPGWELKIWGDDNVPKLINKEEFEAGTSFAQKADILRYEILYQFGGVYIDTDFECLKPIETILDGVTDFIAYEWPDKTNNAIIGSEPGSAFYRFVIERLPYHARKHSYILEQTGPVFLGECAKEYCDHHPHLTADPALGVEDRRFLMSNPENTRSLHIFEHTVFYPYYWNEPEKEHADFPHAFAKHHWHASWR